MDRRSPVLHGLLRPPSHAATAKGGAGHRRAAVGSGVERSTAAGEGGREAVRASVPPAHLPPWGSTATTRKRQDVAEAGQLHACPATVAMLLATVIIAFFTNLSILSNVPHRAAAASSSSPPPLPSSFPGGCQPCPAPPPLAAGRAHHLPSRPSVAPSCYPAAHARCTVPNCPLSMSPMESG
uniref:Uncharacterized protein n=1 Tax=Oryza rufipogon TaxID=4529 RepID=A0A0E0NX70_ORYRU